ncbi:MAG: photosynthetic reaction center subunit H [Hyphomicrobiaceae bacterium]
MLLAFGFFTEHIDLALVSLYIFWGFFFWLVLYIQQEGRREGFPLVSDPDGKPLNQDLWMPAPKTFITNDGRTVLAPDPARADTRSFNAEFAVGGPGSPLVPLGNPMKDGLGAAGWTERPDVPDTTFEMKDRIVPMRIAEDFHIPDRDIDPRGCPMFGCDGVQAGVIKDVWVDRSDFVIRYLEVELPASGTGEDAVPGKRILAPWNMVDLKSDRDWLMEFVSMKSRKPNATFHVRAITAAQFADVPLTRSLDRITYLEEERVMGYFGGGYLYATPDRQEPLI